LRDDHAAFRADRQDEDHLKEMEKRRKREYY